MVEKNENHTAEALKFLRAVYPKGPWVLTAISPERTKVETATFTDSDECFSWIDERNGFSNLYWMVNTPRSRLKKKAEREDVLMVTMFHVDIDPPPGRSPGLAKKIALEKLNEKRSESVPKPSIIIDSGNGIHAYWLLKDPILIDGRAEKYEDAKLYNKQLEILFGGDNCHNIDRIMRLPGTINIPDRKKAQKGYKPVLAEVLSIDTALKYEQSQFVRAVDRGDVEASTMDVHVSGNIQRVLYVEELDRWNVDDRTKVIMVQGKDPEKPKEKDNSRSAWLFDFICQLVRADVPDDVIYSIITDSDWSISASVVDKGSKAHQYAVRQIKKAKEFAIDPELYRLNSEFAMVLNAGGKSQIIRRCYDEVLGRHVNMRIQLYDFKNWFPGEYKEIVKKDGKVKEVHLSKWWMEHKGRNSYESITFLPEQATPGRLNLWQGWAVDAIPGDVSAFLNFVKEIICSGNEDHYQYLINWLAKMVQSPGEPGHVAIVMQGSQGTGKSFFANMIGSLLGQHYLTVSHDKHVVGQFNAHLEDCILLFADEAFFAGNPQHQRVLKQLITEPVIMIERKYSEPIASRNCVHLIMASNEDWVVPAGDLERRYLVLKVSDAQRKDVTYFEELSKKMKSGGAAALLHYLKTLDINGFDPRIAPESTGLQEQRVYSLDPLASWWLGCLGEGLIGDFSWSGQDISMKQLYSQYKNEMRETNQRHILWFDAFFVGMEKYLGELKKHRKNGARYITMPDLKTAREIWVAKTGSRKWEEVPDATSKQTDAF